VDFSYTKSHHASSLNIGNKGAWTIKEDFSFSSGSRETVISMEIISPSTIIGSSFTKAFAVIVSMGIDMRNDFTSLYGSKKRKDYNLVKEEKIR
jgi:hypothetical protein